MKSLKRSLTNATKTEQEEIKKMEKRLNEQTGFILEKDKEDDKVFQMLQE